MTQPYQDRYTTRFRSFADMLTYHAQLASGSRWERAEVNSLRVEPLDESSPLYGDVSAFDPGVSEEAVEDTAKNLGLAITLGGSRFPVRDTAYKSRRFSEVLRSAVAGDPDAMESVISRYMPLINRRSVAGGEFDEDMRQYILLRVIMQIPGFDLDRKE